MIANEKVTRRVMFFRTWEREHSVWYASSMRETLPVVLRSGEDGWIVAECPVLRGCISQGKTRDEALANIREAIELCLEAGDLPAELVQITIAA